MRVAFLLLTFLGTSAAFAPAGDPYLRHGRSLEPTGLFARENWGYDGSGHHPSVSVSSDKNTGADIAIIAAQSNAEGTPTILGDALDGGRAQQIQDAFKNLGFSGAAGSTVRIIGADGDPAKTLLITGVGKEVGPEQLRRAAGVGLRAATGSAEKVAVLFPTDGDDVLHAVAEGAVMGSYSWSKYKSKKTVPVQEIVVVSGGDSGVVDRASTLTKHVNKARDLVNTPPNDLYPENFAQMAQDAANAVGASVEIWDEDRLREDGMNAILAVGSASARKPRLVKVSYNPEGASKHVSLVGKGITFDSGGTQRISLSLSCAMLTNRPVDQAHEWHVGDEGRHVWCCNRDARCARCRRAQAEHPRHRLVVPGREPGRRRGIPQR